MNSIAGKDEINRKLRSLPVVVTVRTLDFCFRSHRLVSRTTRGQFLCATENTLRQRYETDAKGQTGPSSLITIINTPFLFWLMLTSCFSVVVVHLVYALIQHKLVFFVCEAFYSR